MYVDSKLLYVSSCKTTEDYQSCNTDWKRLLHQGGHVLHIQLPTGTDVPFITIEELLTYHYP